jgi:hypothetical protein
MANAALDRNNRRARVKATAVVFPLVFVVAGACGGDRGDAGDPAAGDSIAPSPTLSATRSVTVTAPADGDTVRSGDVHVTLASEGIEIAQAAENRAGSGHHHLLLDTALPAAGQAIPAGVDGIVHLGGGETEYTFTNVPAGEHRLIALIGDPAHVPVADMPADTVHFVVVR